MLLIYIDGILGTQTPSLRLNLRLCINRYDILGTQTPNFRLKFYMCIYL